MMKENAAWLSIFARGVVSELLQFRVRWVYVEELSDFLLLVLSDLRGNI